MQPTPQNSDPFRRLVAIMDALREPGGCPWDREQTHDTLKQYLLEETYEVLEALDDYAHDPAANANELRKELGDLALQIVFHARLAKEAGRFDIDGIYAAICEKLIRRHPHVFGEAGDKTSTEVLKNWERIKQEEKAERNPPHTEQGPSILDGVPKTLPALQRGQRMQEKASNIGFDWPSAQGAFEKIHEELGEIKELLEARQATQHPGVPPDPRLEEEIGDLIFSVVNFARLSGIRAEESMRAAAAKFDRRFRAMESAIQADGLALGDLTLEAMDRYWSLIKEKERNQH